ncbi:Lysophospholipase L1 [Pedobacter westerhofensis]|uniref:Lysophospholipase L1 n=1 Tax=Pedobacter westerhofensis TaxID=425512 RepID=A0A521CYZ6_9SPHI|nr:GDSL-type esterase/lipase family protein [Pedobacter westerhofensis]SMO64654.1 Lysophospholipase L1 [Pedobacter westerhofensis]
MNKPKSILKTILLGLVLVSATAMNASAQEKPPFWDDVNAIKAYDKIYAPPANPILFIGSSSIRLWVDFTKTFKNYTVLNRAIGGAVTTDADLYLKDLVFPYHPKQLVIYVGENDLLKAPDATTVFNDFKKLYGDIRAELPNTPIVYISIKGSPSRKQYQAKAIEANRLISAYIKGQQQITFVDVYHPMLDKNGEMQPGLFKQDMLHMNASGYAIWNKLVLPLLIKD